MRVMHRLVRRKNDMRMCHVNHYIKRDACRNEMSAVLCNNVKVTCNISDVFIFDTFDITLIYFSTVYKIALFRNIVFSDAFIIFLLRYYLSGPTPTLINFLIHSKCKLILRQCFIFSVIFVN